MSQSDLFVDNQTAPAFRSDLNNALQALATLSSGATAPPTTYANMLWYDTDANILKMRSENDDAWINVGYLCQSTNKFCILDDTNVVTTGGTQAGLLGGQSEATWEAGTSTTESLVSPAKVKAAIDVSTGADQTWQDVSSSRITGNSYQNTTGKPIYVSVQTKGGSAFEVSTDNSTWVELFVMSGDRNISRGGQFRIPDGYYYRVRDNVTLINWVELR